MLSKGIRKGKIKGKEDKKRRGIKEHFDPWLRYSNVSDITGGSSS